MRRREHDQEVVPDLGVLHSIVRPGPGPGPRHGHGEQKDEAPVRTFRSSLVLQLSTVYTSVGDRGEEDTTMDKKLI